MPLVVGNVTTTEVPKFTLGDRLKKARIAAGLDQSTLGDRIGYHGNSVSNWENDHSIPRKSTLMLIAEELGVRGEWLLYGVNEA